MNTSQKIITGVSLLVAAGIIAGSTYAAVGGKWPRFDVENAPVEIQEIITQAKENGRDSLTDEQKETVKAYAKEQRQERFDALPSNIQSILNDVKKNGRDSLSDADRETLKEYREANPDVFPGKDKKRGHGGKWPRFDIENAPAEIQEIITQAKENGRDSLTDEQKETVKAYAKEQRQERFDALPSNIQSILTDAKENGRDSLSDADRETLKQYRQENPDAFPGKGKHKR